MLHISKTGIPWLRAGMWMLAGLLAGASDAAGAEIRFNRDIRPILSDNCFACHGPDKNTREADLRLDVPEAAFADSNGQAVIVPGKPDASELYRRITADDPLDRMPPEEANKTLDAAEITRLREWIEQGAEWEGHWAYLPPRRPAIPAVSDFSWPANPIDHFILDRLEREGLVPSPEADRRALIRRLSFDLTGLPPTIAEVDRFLNDRETNAIEKLVDRLLASPHFGERMAVHWLDLVRYADTVGYHGDQPYSVWPYRDYVIEAFNENKPFDEFTIEQLAGDLLPDATREQKVASGYNRLNMITAEGGAQDKEYLAKYAADRVRTTGAVWLGSTMGCAECHDHKFDPITIRDFYSFEAFFADLKEKGFYAGGNKNDEWGPKLQLPDEEQAEEMAGLTSRIARLEITLDTHTEELAAAQAGWEERMRAAATDGLLAWRPLEARSVTATNGTTLTPQADFSVLASGENPDTEVYEAGLESDLETITAFRLEALTHPTMDKKSLSRGGGNFVLSGFEVLVRSGECEEFRPVPIARAEADFEQDGWPVAAALDDDPKTGWAVNGQDKKENRQAVFTLEEPLSGAREKELLVRLRHESEEKRHHIGRFRLSAISLDRPTPGEFGVPENVVVTLGIPGEERDGEQAEEIAAHYRSIAPTLDPTREELASREDRRDQLTDEIPTTLVSLSVEPRAIRLLPRGNWMDDSGEVVEPAVPEFLGNGETPDRRLTRLDLAEWLVSPENPLTARVFVNRLWKNFFGTGISRVLDDLGSQGEWPSHPELLDWLAVEFRESGWDMKHMVRLMVMSRTYRQSSLATEELRTRDPFNRLLARQSRFRLPAEMIRDNALAVSDLLVPVVGGASVKPYQPEGYYAQLNFPKREYEADEGSDQYRRGIYMHWQRTFLHPMLVAFDAPSREECTAERPRSNTPLQALTLLNDPTYVEAARALAERVIEEGGRTAEARVRYAYQVALSREPDAEEMDWLTTLCRNHFEEYREDREAAEKLIQVGQKPVPDRHDPAELAAWTSVARVLLNLHETMVRF